MASKVVPKCIECNHTEFMELNGSPNRYYCKHVDIPSPGRKMLCRTERGSQVMTIKTSPRWCPKRK